MTALERTYTIPLRREWLKAPKYKRAKRAVSAIRSFLCRHMKVEKHTATKNVKLGPQLNLELWKHGIKNPPPRVKVNVSKDDKGVVRAELFGAPKFEEKVAVEEKKGVLAKAAEAVTGKATKPAAPKPAAPAAAKPAAPAAAKPAAPAAKPAEAPKPAAAKPAAPKAPAAK